MSALIPTTDAAGRTLRHDGWTPDRQRAFLEAVAAGETVERACRLVQMSVASAYALKQRATGQSFALGWRAANLLGREAIADRMLTRAIDGYVETVTRPDGATYSRHKYDNRTAMTLLNRLDRMAEQAPTDTDAAAHAQAARFVAQDWEAYLALIDAYRGPAAAGLFLARRLPDTAAKPGLEPVLALARADAFLRTGAGIPQEVATADLDPAQRATWTSEQWARAEAAGLVRLAPAPEDTAPAPQHPPLMDEDEDEDEQPIWWDEAYAEWRTRMAPPPDEIPMLEDGEFGAEDYERTLTDSERAVVDRVYARTAAQSAAQAEAERRAFFADLEAEIAEAEGQGGDGDVTGLPVRAACPELVEGESVEAPPVASAVASRESGPSTSSGRTEDTVPPHHAGHVRMIDMPLYQGAEVGTDALPNDNADSVRPARRELGEGELAEGRLAASGSPLGSPRATRPSFERKEAHIETDGDTPTPGPAWPSFAQMLAGDPDELARYGVRVD